MTFPCELTMPDAVRISVSMRSFSTGARNGSTALSSSVVAESHPDLAWVWSEVGRNIRIKRTRDSFIEVALFEMDEAALNRDGSCVRAVTDTKLAKQVINVSFDCCLGDREVGCDFLIRSTSNDPLEDS